jgi:hypothetical protein
MRIILSRKGFDSANGGCPSPIFRDGSMLALPIPDEHAPVRYRDLAWRGRNVGEVVERRTGGRIPGRHFAHLDPDLRREALPRPDGWRPAFGQRGQAQGHLRNQGVRAGDLFLFWGLFCLVGDDLRRIGADLHVLWGWLQVGAVAAVDRDVRGRLAGEWRWAAGHPHLAEALHPNPSNTLYVGADDLALPGQPVLRGRGTGVFERFDPALQLTAGGAPGASSWSVPGWLFPERRPPLTYHEDRARWGRVADRASLRVTSPGQEFVLDADAYPEAAKWVAGLVEGATGAP